MRVSRYFLAAALIALAPASRGQDASVNLYGMPGLIDMPTGEALPDAQGTATLSYFSGMLRGTGSFQISPRLTGSMRYSALQNCNCFGFATYYDRSLDLHYQILHEGRYRPALAIGLRDLAGTGVYAGEYVAATKHLTTRLKVTGGIGWGRLGSYNSFTNPLSIFGSGFTTRPTGFGAGGAPGVKQWFRGPAAFFGGLEWRTPVKGLSVKAEYSSDAYTFETGAPGLLRHNSPLNFALTYKINPTVSLSGYYLYGSAVGLSTSIVFNPKNGLTSGTAEAAPTPVFRRPRDHERGAADARDTSWTSQADAGQIILGSLQKILKRDGFVVEAISLTGTRGEVRFRNAIFDIGAQAIGRVARVMSRVMPHSIETFVLTPLEDGLPTVSVILSRRDLEDFENDPDGVEKSLARTKLAAPGKMQGQITRNAALYPKLNWSIGPYVRYSLFDPVAPIMMDVGLRAEGRYDVSPGISVSGSFIKKAFGNMDQSTRVSDSLLAHVRTDVALYDKADPVLEYLTADYFFRPGGDLYGRVSAGYLERMYAGVSAEILWKPVNSNFGVGAEANLVQQRAFDGGLGLQTYQVATGHVSVYWDMKKGFSAQVDVGRYLAGDTGATVTLERRFDNGWRIGAFATLTNVPFSTFGEGSFDKGILITVPMSTITNKPIRKVKTVALRPVTRDGGARLDLRNRLWLKVSQYHRARLEPAWGRFWR